MRTAALAIIVLGLGGAGSAGHAGAWPRAEGETFLSFGINLLLFGGAERPIHTDPTLYLEYGLTDRVTLGLTGHTADRGREARALAFARLPLDFGQEDQLAVAVSVGLTDSGEAPAEPAAGLSLHWGRGLSSGWLALDAEVVATLGDGRIESKIDATWGWNWTEDWTSVATVTAGTGIAGDLYAKAGISGVRRLSDRLRLRVSYTQALTGDRGGGLGVETWWVF